MSKLFWEILDDQRLGILKLLSRSLGKDFYLAGGTALALQIGHRESLDFDLFRAKEISLAVKQKLLKTLAGSSLQTLVDTSDELTITIDQTVKVTLLNYFWPPILPLRRVSGALPLLSVKEIAAAKAYALGRRGNYRDHFDLYVIVKNGHVTLKQIIKIAKKKYGDIFSERMFLEQLLYAGEMRVNEQLRYLAEKPASPEKITAFFKAQVAKLRS